MGSCGPVAASPIAPHRPRSLLLRSTTLRSGQGPQPLAGSRARPSRRNRMERCVARTISPSIRRNGAPNTMARCASSMPLASAVAVPVPYGHAVRNTEPPPSILVASARCSGHTTLPRPRGPSLWPFLLRCPCCGTTGVVGNRDVQGCACSEDNASTFRAHRVLPRRLPMTLTSGRAPNAPIGA
jgi:hypothetical protein